MTQAQNSITASTSRRNFIKSGAAVIAALAVPALANAAPSIEAEIASVTAEYERHGYRTIAVVLKNGKTDGFWIQTPMVPVDWPDELACHKRWNDCFKNHRPDLEAYLIKTGRVHRHA